MKKIFLMLFFVFLICFSSFSFDDDRHKIIAGLALKYLEENNKISSYNQIYCYSLADVAIWADFMKKDPSTNYHNSDKWHYTDLDVSSDWSEDAIMNKYVNSSPSSDTLISQLINEIASFNKDSQNASNNFDNYKFIIHFMGDIHMPLHCAAQNADSGGNSKILFFPDLTFSSPKQNISLHAMWDNMPTVFRYKNKENKDSTTDNSKQYDIGDHFTAIIDYLYAGSSGIITSENKTFSDEIGKSGMPGWISHIMSESNSIAKNNIYDTSFLGSRNPLSKKYELNYEDYTNDKNKIAKTQIIKAGIRLGILIDYLFSNNHKIENQKFRKSL